ncbi:GTP 3',8-cyclase MoaA [Sessilibacter sp. MAH2]
MPKPIQNASSPTTQIEPTPKLVDSFGRAITYLRLSVTDRCDFRCVYCMAEEMTFVPRAQLCTLEELAQIAQAFTELGVTKIRLTGGEPLIRRSVETLLGELGAIKALNELVITTNGSHLKEHAQTLKDAGVKRINVSLDTLDPIQFKELTRTGNLNTVLEGIDHCKSLNFARIKLNAVILKHRNLDQVVPLIEFAKNHRLDISFIEEMPLGVITEHQRDQEFVSSAQLRELITECFDIETSSANTGGPSRYWQVKGSSTKIGFISPHSENFCASCNRVRVSAEGKLLLCLGNEHAIDLKAVLRAHPNNIEKLKQAIVNAIGKKPEKHHFEQDDVQIVRFMNATGG